MRSVLKNAFAGLTLGTGLLLVGCASGNADAPPSHVMAKDAVQCDSCKITWAQTPTVVQGDKGHSKIVGYHATSKMECPDCRSMAANFFETGKLEHHCSACDGNMAICEAH